MQKRCASHIVVQGTEYSALGRADGLEHRVAEMRESYFGSCGPVVKPSSLIGAYTSFGWCSAGFFVKEWNSIFQ